MKHLKFPLLLGISVILLSSCSTLRNPLAAPHNAVTEKIAVATDSELVNTMKSWQPGISFQDALPAYNKAEASIMALLAIDTTRKHNTQIVSLTNTWLSQLEQTKAAHQSAGVFNSSQLSINLGLLKQAGHIVVTTEQKYK